MTLIEDEPPRTLPRIASMRAAVEVRFGIGSVAPIEHAAVVHPAEAERDVDVRVPIAAAGFDEQDARASASSLSRFAKTQPAEPAPTMM